MCLVRIDNKIKFDEKSERSRSRFIDRQTLNRLTVKRSKNNIRKNRERQFVIFACSPNVCVTGIINFI